MNDSSFDFDYTTMNLRDAKSPEERRSMINAKYQLELSAVASTLVDLDGIHCENLVGAVSLPLGVAGPLTIDYNGEKSERLIPLATTEGALVASVSRGSKVISLAGGATADVKLVGTTRGPVFETSGIRESRKLERWIQEKIPLLKAVATTTSGHLNLIDIEIQINGKFVYTRFVFDTDEAMGMNMVTIASDALVSEIESRAGAHCLAVAGNYDIDKKPGWLNSINGRGRVCTAEVQIASEIVKEYLHVDVADFVKTVRAKCWGGSMMAGSMGYNAHFANIAAAFFAATGQDIAHTVEASLGITSAEVQADGSLYFSVYMPDVMLGIIGGGTKLKTQSEARSLTQAKSTDELAAVFVSAVLAGELSLLASITEKTLGKAHKKLGR